jgi:hypothetical protein
MSAKALIAVAVVCLAGVLLGDSRSLAHGGGGSHGGFNGGFNGGGSWGGTWGGRGGRMGGFSMHGSAWGHHGEREHSDGHDRHGRRDDRRDRYEHWHDHRYGHWHDHHWHHDQGFGDRGNGGPHPEGTWSRGSGFGDSHRGQTAGGQWHVENR